MTDYEKQYQRSLNVCGPPFKELVAFFDESIPAHSDVLDLGCGQGRDALFIARLGHHVLGVDISRTGIAQMLEVADEEGLDLSGIVSDVVEYEPSGEYDVVIFDRLLHMFRHDNQRLTVLEKASRVTKPGGFILIADTPKQQQLIRSFFDARSDSWMKIKDRNGFMFFQKR